MERASPLLGAAVGYFVVVSWAIPKGYIPAADVAEAVVMSGAIFTSIFMEIRGLVKWIGSLIKKDDK